MPSEVLLHLQSVVGEVIEVYPSGGKSVATVALRVLHVPIPVEVLDDPHLGERVSLDIHMTIRDYKTLRANGYPAAEAG